MNSKKLNVKRIVNILLLTCFTIMFIFCAVNITKALAEAHKIVLKNAVITDKSDTVEASITSFDKDGLVTDVTYHKVNDYVNFKLTIKNNDSKKYTIKNITDNNTYTYIVYDYDKHINEEIKPNEEKVIEIRATYKNEVTDMSKRVKQNSVEFKILLEDENGQEDDKVIPINPDTSDNLFFYLAFGLLSLAGILVVLKNRTIKKSLLVLLLMTPFITRALTLSYVINVNDNIKLYDKMLVTVDVAGEKQELIVPYNTKIDEPTVVTRPGYNFVGWFANNEEVDFTKGITKDMDIVAKYDIITYNISYNLDGGTATNPSTYTVEDTFTLNNPTKKGYTFAGWTGSNGEGLQTRVTVNKGTTEDLNYVAHFSESEDTPYKVFHRYKNLNADTYTTEEENLTGVTNSTVYPQIKHKDGFVDPSVQSLEISPNGDSYIEYFYTRETYTYAFNENVNSTLSAGTYEYQTEITVTPKSVTGYHFDKWEDNSTDNPRTITLSGNTSVVPQYAPNEDTAYTVHHNYQNLNGGYDTEDVTGHGITGTTVPAALQPRDGFKTPTSQNVEILADGSGSVTYTYDREEYAYAFGENITSSLPADSYMYETEITVTANDVAGYTFSHWEDDSTTNPRTITLTANMNVAATYTANTDTAYTVHHDYQNLYDGYDRENITEHGTTGTTVDAPIKSRTGFVDPSIQQVTILGTGLAEVTYTYNRETYTYAFGEHITSTLAADTYKHGTTITVEADDVDGYTFSHWEDNTNTNPRTITLTSNMNVTATYTPNGDTPYTVSHYKQQLDGTYSSVADDTDHLTGVTDTDATPAIKSYTGFTAPSVQTKKINGNGSTEFKYQYTRNKYNLTLTNAEYIQEGDISDEYYYEEQITLTAATRPGYTFTGWSNGESTNSITITMEAEDVTVGPEYEINYYNFVSNSPYVTSSEPSGSYPYGTTIPVTANDRPGYTFSHWEDDVTTTSKVVVLTGDTEVIPTYTANTNTAYTVHHRYENLTGGYDVENSTEHGTTATTVNAPIKSRTGFTTPETQQVTIEGDGSSEVTYTYDRLTYTFSITDRTYIAAGSTADDTYKYGTEISVTAISRAGYTFKWSDDDTSLTKTFNLSENVTLSTVYTANTNTAYTVNHYKQNLDGTYPSVATETDNLTGTTDSQISPTVRDYTGFDSPDVQSTTINGDGSTVVDYYYVRKTYTFTKDAYTISETADGTYPYGTSITVTAATRAGYTFSEWEEGTTTVSRVFTLTANTSVAPSYAPNTDTPYTINHFKQQLDGTYLSVPDDTDNLTGTTESSVTPATNSYTGFTSPSTETVQILGDGTTTLNYQYTRNKYALTLTNTEYIQQGDISGNYYYEQQITLTAATRPGYTFTGWSNGESTNSITITMGTSPVTVGPEYTINSYTITFNTQGGLPQPSSRVITYGNQIGALPDDVAKDGYTFAGWYDDPDNGTQITATTVIDGTVTTYYAHWEEIVIPSIICKKATILTTEECQSGVNNSKGCKRAGYAGGATITYGTVIDSDTYSIGDAFDCNVDGTGYNQRFYYLRTKDNKAVLISNQNFEGANGQQNANNFVYSEALSKLPVKTQWSNLDIVEDNRVARLLTMEDLLVATNSSQLSQLTTADSLKAYPFLFESIGYSHANGRSTIWIEEYTDPDNSSANGRYRMHINTLDVVKITDNPDASKNCVRPVIEVPLVSIEDDYVIKFDAMGGTLANEYIRVAKGSEIGTLPTPTRTDYVNAGWYTAVSGGTQITSSTVPVDYDTYYARWYKKAEAATLNSNSIVLLPSGTDQITILDNDVESVTYTSNDTSVATVDSSGNITAIDDGITSITITGTLSGTTQSVTVTVQDVAINYTISFDAQGGSPVPNDMYVPMNTAISSLPTASDITKTDYTFGGWFTDTSFGTEVTTSTIVHGNMTLHAKWIPDDAVAELNNNQFFTTIQDAIDAAPTTQSTVKVLKDVTETSGMIADLYSKNYNKNITLDLNGHTLTMSTNQDTSNCYVIRSRANLTVKNGTMTSSSKGAAVEANAGEMILDNVTVTGTGIRQAVYIKKDVNQSPFGSPVVDVQGGSYLESMAEAPRGTIHNVDGTLNVKDATVVSTTKNALYTESSTAHINIGIHDGIATTSTPIIIGEQYGVGAKNGVSNAIFFYDGIIKGLTGAVDNRTTILPDANIETNYQIKDDDTEQKPGTSSYYKLLYLVPTTNNYVIQLDYNGGTGTQDYISVVPGNSVAANDIVDPTKGLYTFDGWYYDDDTFQSSVVFPYTPSGNEAIHAKWTYVVNPNPVQFTVTSDVIADYYTNIGTWKNQVSVSGTKSDESGYTETLNTTQFETSMRTNFDAHNCSYCGTDANQNKCDSPSAGNYCERPKGFDTGVTDGINVYEYNTSTQEATLVTYTTTDNGVIYNMIPGKTYKWESTTDNNIYGFVNPVDAKGRRTIYSNVRNVRDLGGMEVSFTREENSQTVTKTGTIKYGKLYRGAAITGGQSAANSLTKLGITREVDLRSVSEGGSPARLPKHDKCDSNCSSITSAQDIIMTNYIIYPNDYPTNYTALRDTMTYVMQSVVNGDNIYFHCTIGTDRTGTLAYFLEGLLGASEEDRLEDYEFSYFYGMLNRHRFHDNLQSGAGINPRFLSMYKTYDTNEKIYNFYMLGSSDTESNHPDKDLIEAFRDAMIDYD